MRRPSTSEPSDDRAALEAEVERLKGALDAAQREQARLRAVLGHELRNPIATIQTALDVMELRAPDTLVRERQVMGRQLRRLVQVVDGLLAHDRSSTGTLSGAPLLSSPRRILVVDDNLDLAETLAEAITMLGHEVRVAHDGPQALAVAGIFGPDIALVDIGLPVMDGHEVARRLQALPRAPRRLIAVTGYGTAADRRAALDAGFDDHVAKPLDLARLAAILTATDV